MKNEYKRTHIHKVKNKNKNKNCERNIYNVFVVNSLDRGKGRGRRVRSIKSATSFDEVDGLQDYVFVVIIG